MPVLSVDLAIRNWSDLGVVFIEHSGPRIACEIITWTEDSGGFPPPVVELALRLNTLCLERGAGVLMLDGPQAWKAEETASDLPRPDSSNRTSPPVTYERFVGYCLALYDALGRLGWKRMVAIDRAPTPAGNREKSTQRKTLVESYPNAAWKSLGIAPLPVRQACRVSDLAEAWAALTAVLPVTANRPPNHNQMQALVGGLPGLAIASDLDGEAATPSTESSIWMPAQMPLHDVPTQGPYSAQPPAPAPDREHHARAGRMP